MSFTFCSNINNAAVAPPFADDDVDLALAVADTVVVLDIKYINIK